MHVHFPLKFEHRSIHYLSEITDCRRVHIGIQRRITQVSSSLKPIIAVYYNYCHLKNDSRFKRDYYNESKAMSTFFF